MYITVSIILTVAVLWAGLRFVRHQYQADLVRRTAGRARLEAHYNFMLVCFSTILCWVWPVTLPLAIVGGLGYLAWTRSIDWATK